MYHRDMRKVRKHGLSGPAGLVDVVTFAILTIQQPLQTVGRQFDDIRENGAGSAYLFGSKRNGYLYACEHAETLFAAVSKASEVGDTVAAIDVLACVPSLGIVKASFVAQLLGFEVACLDRHNLARLGYAETAFKFPKSLKPETRLRKIADYVRICSETGGAAYWWNTWCSYVAGNRGSPLKTAAQVSAYHWQAIGIGA